MKNYESRNTIQIQIPMSMSTHQSYMFKAETIPYMLFICYLEIFKTGDVKLYSPANTQSNSTFLSQFLKYII